MSDIKEYIFYKEDFYTNPKDYIQVAEMREALPGQGQYVQSQDYHKLHKDYKTMCDQAMLFQQQANDWKERVDLAQMQIDDLETCNQSLKDAQLYSERRIKFLEEKLKKKEHQHILAIKHIDNFHYTGNLNDNS